MRKLYKVDLSDAERSQLLELAKKGSSPARKVSRVHILLAAHDGAHDAAIAAALHVGRATVERVRKRFVEHGLERALSELPRPGAPRKLDGRQEAQLVVLACSDPPSGQKRWTIRLLADRLVELEVVESVSHETVHRLLQQNELKPWLKQQWCLPPQGQR